jgi:hypothetical protein
VAGSVVGSGAKAMAEESADSAGWELAFLLLRYFSTSKEGKRDDVSVQGVTEPVVLPCRQIHPQRPAADRSPPRLEPAM